ncbi:G-protein coupled receptor 84 [Chanos chanos]|uniref:G-protein coupled receptor 84 n=1 Tax=Chanos chanos TaxID=29144 RepID=A0A6J2VRH1_CHACN|nr:G-protein coupled receptor 84 [Chanos chanos]
MSSNDTDVHINASFSCADPSVEGYRYLGVVWGSAVTLVGTLGNVLTVLAFATDSHLRTRFNVLIVNLALADLLYCTLLQPISVDSYLHLRWRGGDTWCRIFGLLLFLSNSVSILTLCLIAISRYLLIAHRNTRAFRVLFSTTGLALVLASTWALGLASFGPLWPVYVFAQQVCTCSFHRTRGRPYTTVLLFLYFFLGLGCVGFFYLLIYQRVSAAAKALLRYRPSRRSSRRKRPEPEGSTDSGMGGGATTTATHSSEIGVETEEKDPRKEEIPANTQGSYQIPPTAVNQDRHKPAVPAPVPTQAPVPTSSGSSGEDSEFKRVTRMCFTVFVCFVCCFAPFLLLNIADKQNKAPQVLHMFCANLTWLNSCINPLLYAAMNRQFNQAYRQLLSKALTPLTRFHRLS